MEALGNIVSYPFTVANPSIFNKVDMNAILLVVRLFSYELVYC
jgi:hypothetical protein